MTTRVGFCARAPKRDGSDEQEQVTQHAAQYLQRRAQQHTGNHYRSNALPTFETFSYHSLTRRGSQRHVSRTITMSMRSASTR